MSNNVENKASEAAVTDVANTLANTHIDKAEDKNTDAVLASAAEGRRLYIGNLAYATKEGELKDFFKSYLVESVSIPKNPRTDKPVGYAFVDVSTPSEAEQAIRELSGQEILGRKVSVQLARKPEPNTEKHDNGEGSAGEGTRRRASGRGRGRGRGGRGGRSAQGGRKDGSHDDGADEQATGSVDAGAEAQPLGDITNKDTSDLAGKKTQPRTPRERKERGPPADGIPSKTKVMVANLPYELTEEKLKELFAAYNPLSAKIALRPIPRFMIKKLQARGEQRKGRGFGFVTLESEEMQQKAVEEMNAKEIDGREIAVKVAIDSPDKTDDHENEHGELGEEAEKPANGTEEAAPAAPAAPASADATAA